MGTSTIPNKELSQFHIVYWPCQRCSLTKLSNFLTFLEITRPQAVSIATKLLSYIRAACWDKIWVPRCAQFQNFIRSKGITPAQQRSGPPPGFSRSLSSGSTTDRLTSDRLSQPYATLVANYLSYGKGYPFPWCNNCVIFLVRWFRSCVCSFSHWRFVVCSCRYRLD